jgi:hypothetical protein
VPLTDFWNRWRRKLPQPERQDSAPTLLEAEKQRRGATRQAAKAGHHRDHAAADGET